MILVSLLRMSANYLYVSVPSTKDVIEFVARRFPNAKEDLHWVSGNCYYFAVILKTRFPLGHIIYDVIDGHFLFLYNNLLIDASGSTYIDTVPIIGDDNFKITDTLIVWDYFDKYDSLQYQRIIRDCIE